MADFLQRAQSPLSDAQWAVLEHVAVQTASAILVGRRFISLTGPFGAGIEALASDTLRDTAIGQIDLLGDAEEKAISVESRRYLPLPLLYKDFWLHWRDIEASSQLGLPLNTTPAAAAATATAWAEDHLILDGEPVLGLAGLRTVEGHQSVPMGDWGMAGEAFAAVVRSVQLLTTQGFPGPYALVLSPELYAQLHRIFDNTGVLEIEQVEKLARRGIYPTSVLPEGTALLVDSSPQNMDLAVALDLSPAYVESTNLNHRFRILESLLLRIHRPGAICTFEPPTVPANGRRARRA
jgi:uncharacterized linocin/CFP29 family protein